MNTVTAGSLPAADPCAANDNFFDRAVHVRPGHRFYSSEEMLKWLIGREESEKYSSRGVRVKWNGKSGDDCVTTPLPAPVCSSFVMPPPPATRPADVPALPRENDGPTAGWREKATAIWVAMPAADSAIFARKAETDSPRHGGLAERCAPTLAWIRAKEPIATSLRHDPANDNVAANPDRAHAAGSSPDALVVAHKKGKLRFSNGVQTEKAYKRKGDGVVLCDVRMPKGALLNYPDKPGTLLGPKPNPEAIARGNGYWASLFGVDVNTVVDTDEDGNKKPRFIPAGKRKKRKVLITREEQQELIATALRPAVTYCPPGLPRGSASVSDSFVGMHIASTKGRQAPERWQDTADNMAREEEFKAWLEALPEPDVKALNVASTAANLSEIGEAFGYSGKAAERKGKKMLMAANDNFAEILQKAA